MPRIHISTFVILSLIFLPATTQAALLQVDAAVAVSNDGLCSLVEAIHNANADAQVDNTDCLAGSSDDRLILSPDALYLLETADPANDHNGLPVITSTLIIEGEGATIERDDSPACVLDGTKQAHEFRLLQVDDPAVLTLENLTLRGGCADGSGPSNDGGAIRINGSELTLLGVLVENNSAHDKSGGIDMAGTTLSVTALQSTFRGNFGGGGVGAIGVGDGILILEEPTVSGNSSGGDGGGGIGVLAMAEIRHSTFSGNSSTGQGGGGVANGGTTAIEFSTFVGNSVTGPVGGGGIGNVHVLEIKNSIVADNGAGGDCVSLGAFSAFGDNFDTDGSCAAVDVDFTQVTPMDLDLGVLADGGGPTETHTVGSASVALDAVSDCTLLDGVTTPSLDQRGYPRLQDGDGSGGAACDAGSYERFETGVDVITVNGLDCSLGNAIQTANSDFSVGGCENERIGADEIILLADLSLNSADEARSGDLHGAFAALPDITSEITLQAGTGSRIERDPALDCDVADGPDEFRLFNVVSGGSLALSEVTLANGCADRGGAVLVTGTGVLTADDTQFLSNTARGTSIDAQGGAIWSEGTGSLAITNSLFEANLAAGESAAGGALWDVGALGALAASRFLGNEARSDNGPATGGAAVLHGSPVLSFLVFRDNLAQGHDGSGVDGGLGQAGALFLHVDGGEVPNGAVIADTLFAGNVARGGDSDMQGGPAEGGALESYGSDAGTALNRVTFSSNRAEGGLGETLPGGRGEGGAIMARSIVGVTTVTFSRNVAAGGDSAAGAGGAARGGAIVSSTTNVPMAIAYSTFSSNQAAAGFGGSGNGVAEGGGLYVSKKGAGSFSSLFEGNTTTVGATTVDSPCFNGGGSSSFISGGFNTVAGTSPDCSFNGFDQLAVGPSLLPLGSYGCSAPLADGMCLLTHPVRIGSPAHDAASCAGAGADARGVVRPWDDPDVANVNDGCDAGAYESRDLDDSGLDDDYEVVSVFTDGFESGDTTAW